MGTLTDSGHVQGLAANAGDEVKGGCPMTAPVLTDTPAHAGVDHVARIFASIRLAFRLAFSWLGAAFARVQEARLEAEVHRMRHRIGRMDDERPTIV
jgi:hypothetical protein